MTTRQELKQMYVGTREVPQGYVLCSGWGCDPPTDHEATSVQSDPSGRDNHLYVWLEEA